MYQEAARAFRLQTAVALSSSAGRLGQAAELCGSLQQARRDRCDQALHKAVGPTEAAAQHGD